MALKTFDLEDRLVTFAVLILDLADCVPRTSVAKHLAYQLARSGTSAALNYGEAQAAESGRDFIHKLKLSLKELRETMVCLKILKSKGLVPSDNADNACVECNELIAIFVVSIRTKRRNMNPSQ